MLKRAVIVVAVVVALVASAIAIWQRNDAASFRRERDALSDSIRTREQAHTLDSVRFETRLVLIDTLTTKLTASLKQNRILRAESDRLHQLERDVPIIPSVPGEAPTVGDTLRQCRAQLALCTRRAELERFRADSLAQIVFQAKMEASSLREDVVVWKQSAQTNIGMLKHAQSLLARAAPPCRIPLVVAHPSCPPRRDVLLYGASAALFATADSRDQRYIAGALLLFTFVW